LNIEEGAVSLHRLFEHFSGEMIEPGMGGSEMPTELMPGDEMSFSFVLAPIGAYRGDFVRATLAARRR